MPVASSTNPPMNWGFTSEKEGFFYSINRSQYGGSLDEQLLRTVGRLAGTNSLQPRTTLEDSPSLASWEVGRAQQVQRWSGFFWYQLWRNFGPLGLPCFFASLFLIRSQPLPQRTWLYLMMIGFFLAAFLQPIFDGAEIDRAGWWLQMPYHTYTMFFFALPGILGAGFLLQWARNKSRILAGFLLTLLVLSPFWVGWKNYDVCSQRERWFGWKFGHDMLQDLPENAFVFGGTDPGRFVPTYMILGESTTAPGRKINASFDRRDLFIVTQNAMTDPFYFKYIRDHYTASRPPAKNAFEHWLGRENQYPDAFVELPSDDEVRSVIAEGIKSGTDPMDVNSEVAKLIWERNKDQYPFYVEESFPLKWSYNHAVPHGLIYEILPEPLEEIPAGAVQADLEFWENTMHELLTNPRFPGDYDARRSFSGLRQSIANLYLHREMNAEAETAMRQALELFPGNGVALLHLSRLLWDQGRYDDAIEIWESAVAFDPNNLRYEYLRAVALSRPEWEEKISGLRAKLVENPQDEQTRRELISVLLHIAEEEKADEEIAAALGEFPHNEEFLNHLLGIEINRGKVESVREIANHILVLNPQEMTMRLLLASLALQRGDADEFYAQAREAVNVGGAKAREMLQRDGAFRSMRNEEEFQNLVR